MALLDEIIRNVVNCGDGLASDEDAEAILQIVNACAKDTVFNNLKQANKSTKYRNGLGMEALNDVKKMLDNKLHIFGIVIKISIETNVCGQCQKVDYTWLDESSPGSKANPDLKCKDCKQIMSRKGPTILITSQPQMKNARSMLPDGVFKQATVFLDHQPSRIHEWNTLTCSFYDFHLQVSSKEFNQLTTVYL